MPTTPPFTVVLRGYHRQQVEALVHQAEAALASSDQALRSYAREAIQEPTLQIGLRGYDRAEVDTYLTRLAEELAGASPNS